jgi:putative flavoprotein involved in K+ transport
MGQLHLLGGGSLREKYDTVIIGGGQTGLAMSYCLRQRGREHIVLERQRVAERWRTERWDSLRFQLPNSWLGTAPSSIYQTDAIHYRNPENLPPGAVLIVGSGNSGCQIADELLHSGRRVFLAISRHSRVPRRYRGKDVIWWYENLGRFDVNIDTFPGRRYPPTIIITGIDGGHDLDPRRLGRAGATLLGRVLGITDGTLALADDADQLLAAADKSYAGFIEAADALAATLSMSSELQPKEASAPLPPLRVDGIRRLNLREENINSIIWANGYGYSFDWLKLPITDANGAPIQQRGVTACAGVYFLGLHWMHTFRSAVLSFVGRDAAYLADHIDHLAL